MSCLKHVIEAIDLLDDPNATGEKIKRYLEERGINYIEVIRLEGEKGATDLIKIILPGISGREMDGGAPTLGIVGRLGGIGVRPQRMGLVSDADGAIVALATAIKLGEMMRRGDRLQGDIIITTHINPNSLITPHDPVPFVSTPVDFYTLLKHEVDPAMDAVLSIDATKGNRIIKVDGFAITPTVKKGWILKVSDDLINIYWRIVGDAVRVVPITMQDITPLDSGIYHINSIMLPWLVTDAPVVGVATTAKIPIAGPDTGANYIFGLEMATRFCVEVAKEYTSGRCRFYDEEEYKKLVESYGDMSIHLRRTRT